MMLLACTGAALLAFLTLRAVFVAGQLVGRDASLKRAGWLA